MENTTETPEEVYKFSPWDLLYFIVPIILIGFCIFRSAASEEDQNFCTRRRQRTEIEHL